MFPNNTWHRLLLPTALTAATLGLCAWWTLNSVGGAVLVPVGCVVTLLGCLWMIRRDACAAAARLRNPQLRGTTLRGTGIYECLLRETLQTLADSESKTQSAAQSRNEL